MIIRLHRDVLAETFTLGVVTIDYLSFGYSVEDADRGLDQADPVTELKAKKIHGKTAIPAGVYRVKTTWSNRFQRMMPLVLDVPGFAGVRLHPGNSAANTEGCILLGLARDVKAGTVSRSKAACTWLDAEIARVEAEGGVVTLEVTRGS